MKIHSLEELEHEQSKCGEAKIQNNCDGRQVSTKKYNKQEEDE
jgi:hypothetical protein